MQAVRKAGEVHVLTIADAAHRRLERISHRQLRRRHENRDVDRIVAAKDFYRNGYPRIALVDEQSSLDAQPGNDVLCRDNILPPVHIERECRAVGGSNSDHENAIVDVRGQLRSRLTRIEAKNREQGDDQFCAARVQSPDAHAYRIYPRDERREGGNCGPVSMAHHFLLRGWITRILLTNDERKWDGWVAIAIPGRRSSR